MAPRLSFRDTKMLSCVFSGLMMTGSLLAQRIRRSGFGTWKAKAACEVWKDTAIGSSRSLLTWPKACFSVPLTTVPCECGL